MSDNRQHRSIVRPLFRNPLAAVRKCVKICLKTRTLCTRLLSMRRWRDKIDRTRPLWTVSFVQVTGSHNKIKCFPTFVNTVKFNAYTGKGPH